MEKKEDSLYRLLGSLPEFVKKEQIPLKDKERDKGRDRTPEAPPVAPPPVVDDASLLSEAMKGVTRLTEDKRRISKTAKRARVKGKIDEAAELERVLGDETLEVANLPEYMEGRVEGLNPLVTERLREGVFSVQRVLDLHGCSVNEAHDLFHEFLEGAIKSNARCVRIIHGRGLKSKAGPVLKEKLKEWILEAMHRKWILAFTSARMQEGGPGATLLLIRTRPAKKRLRIIG